MNSPLPESNFVDDTMLYSIFKIQNFELEFSKSVSDIYQFKLQEAKTEFVKICIGIAIALQKNDLEYLVLLVEVQDSSNANIKYASYTFAEIPMLIKFTVQISPLLFIVNSIHLIE